MIIYKATNKINNKCYIGQTVGTLEDRIKRHLTKTGCIKFHNALIKYGSDNFKWTILEICFSQEELNEKEKWYIKHFNSYGENGYNLNEGGGGQSGLVFSEEHKQKISIANKGKKYAKGKKWTQKSKDKLSKSKIGIKCTDEAKIKHSEAAKKNNNMKKFKDGHIPWNKGKNISDESKKKISEKMKGKPWSEKRRNAQKIKKSL